MALPRSFAVLHHVHQKGLPAGHVEGVDQTLKCVRNRISLMVMRWRGSTQPAKGLTGSQRLSPEQNLSAIEPVYQYAGQGGEKERRDLPHETDQAEQ